MHHNEELEAYAHQKAQTEQEKEAQRINEINRRVREELAKIAEEKKKKDDETLRQKELEEEQKRLKMPQEMTIDSVPANYILDPPINLSNHKEPKNIQIESKLGGKRLYYTAVIEDTHIKSKKDSLNGSSQLPLCSSK